MIQQNLITLDFFLLIFSLRGAKALEKEALMLVLLRPSLIPLPKKICLAFLKEDGPRPKSE